MVRRRGLWPVRGRELCVEGVWVGEGIVVGEGEGVVWSARGWE